MKRLNLGLSFIAALSIYSTANAQSLADALTNGKISGEELQLLMKIEILI